MVIDQPQNHGWNDDFDYLWAEEIYPAGVCNFLVNVSNRTSDDEEEDYEIDEELDDIFDEFEMDEISHYL